jgi:RNA polymerase sigma factor (TIGR02999 family)
MAPDKPQHDPASDTPAPAEGGNQRPAQSSAAGDVTRILSQIEQGEPQAAEKLLPLVYEELRKLAAAKMAQEKPGQTLQATALVHEAYLRLVDADRAKHWDSRGHFFAAAAEAMRRILINRARDKGRLRHGGGQVRIDFDRLEIAVDDPSDSVLVVDDALTKLANEDPQAANLLKLRFFAGLTMDQAASALGLSQRTAYRCWAFARAWLYDRVTAER